MPSECDKCGRVSHDQAIHCAGDGCDGHMVNVPCTSCANVTRERDELRSALDDCMMNKGKGRDYSGRLLMKMAEAYGASSACEVLRKERDEAIAHRARGDSLVAEARDNLKAVAADYDRVIMERDEAQQALRERDVMRDERHAVHMRFYRHLEQERDEAQAEIHSLQAEIDQAHELLWCNRRRGGLVALAAQVKKEVEESGAALQRWKQADAEIRAALLIAWPPGEPPEYVDTETLAARVVTELGRLRKIERAAKAWANCWAHDWGETWPNYTDDPGVGDVVEAILSGIGPTKGDGDEEA